MNKHGFTAIELLVTISVLTIMACIAVPGYSRWLPGHKLKSAAKQLFSSMQLAKMTAIRNNGQTAVVFDEDANTYQVVDGGDDGVYGTGDDDVTIRTINLSDFGSGVAFGIGSASTGAGGSSADPITFSGDPPRVVFNSRGMTEGGLGYAHLENKDERRSYAVGTLLTGVIRFRKWDGSAWD